MDSIKKQMTEQTQTEQQKIKVPDGAELIDDVFYVWKTRFGLHTTMTKSGRKMLTGMEKKMLSV